MTKPKRGTSIDPAASVADAIVRLQKGPPVLAIVDSGGKVVGTLSDADVRRAVLDGKSPEVPVSEAMAEPVTAPATSSDDELLRVVMAHRSLGVPLVKDDKFVDVRLAADLPQWEEPLPIAVVMAGGRGQRLRPLTDKVPKPLLKVGSTSIIERIISALGAAGVLDVYLSVNYKASSFEDRLGSGDDLGVSLTYLRERKKLGTAGSLSMLPEPPEGPILVTNADILTRLDFTDLFDYHRSHGGPVTVAAVHHVTQIPYGVVRVENGRLSAIEEKPELRVLCNAGIYVLSPEVLQLVRADESLDMPELIERALGEGMPVNVFPILERWFDIGSPEDFQRVLMEFATGEEE